MLDRGRKAGVARRVVPVRASLCVTLGVVLAIAAVGVAGAASLPRSITGAARAPRADETPAGRHWLPGFALETSDGVIEQPAVLSDETMRTVATPVADVDVVQVADEQWELVVRARATIASVTFPWRSRASALDTSSPSTVLLYPAMLGIAVQAPSAPALALDWRKYPGDCFAPLLVLADRRTAEVVAATTWPPRTVQPRYARDGLAMRWPASIAAGETRRHRVLIARRVGDERAGNAPWLAAALAYRSWLAPHLDEAKLRPVDPRWLVESDGWQNVQLQNLVVFDGATLDERWRRWKGLLPWVQLWGQMSDYAGRGLLSSLAAREQVGCCIDRVAVHERYQAQLPEVVGDVAAQGRIGFYARPRSPYPRLDGPAGEAERRFLLGWLAKNRDLLGANAFYVDVLGHKWFGEPLDLARFVRDQLPDGTVIEYAVDVYPRAALVSGSLTGGSIGGGSEREPRELGALAVPRTTFPRFGRAVLGEQSLFLGESNGDHVFWGAANAYWAERQAFLLGAKLDAMHVAESAERPEVPNVALAHIIALRRATGWWRRAPEYLDRQGVSDVPAGIDVRRFRGRDGETLLVVDNLARAAGTSIRVDGRAVALTADPLSIRVLETGA
jgi:hypothetical protein